MVGFGNADEFFETAAQGNQAYRFQDIDGIGPATENKITSVRGIDRPEDVKDMSADELSDKAGISYSRAEKAIKGAGGNPNISKVSNNTGSVSAAGIQTRQGEFMVEIGDLDKARARNGRPTRTSDAVRADERQRAPITTDLEKWKNNKSEFDFPGVDTPTQKPKVLPKDYKKGEKPQTREFEEEQTESSGPDLMREIGGENVYSEDVASQGPEGAIPGLAPNDFTMSAGESQIADGPGGPAVNYGLERVRETDRPEEEQAPPERALRAQQRDSGLAGQDSRGASIAFIYRNQAEDTDLSLSEFRKRTERVGRKLGLEADAFGNAQMVAEDPNVVDKF
jgi:hypothetical protein